MARWHAAAAGFAAAARGVGVVPAPPIHALDVVTGEIACSYEGHLVDLGEAWTGWGQDVCRECAHRAPKGPQLAKLR